MGIIEFSDKTPTAKDFTMTLPPPHSSNAPRKLGAMVLFAVVYLAALAIIFAPQGSLSSRATAPLAMASQ